MIWQRPARIDARVRVVREGNAPAMEVLPEVIGHQGLLTARPEERPGAVPVERPLRSVLRYVTYAWMFGAVWQMAVTSEPVTLFAQKLGASNFQFGLLTALPFIASLMSVVGSVLVELTGKRKGLFLAAFYVQRAMWVGIGLVPVWMVSKGGWGVAGASLTVFLWMVFVMYAVGAVGSPAWTCWMADVVPARINGKYFSRRRQWGNVTAIPAAIFVGWFLDHISGGNGVTTLLWCAVLFIGCAFCGLMDIHLFSYVPPVAGQAKEPSRILAAFRATLSDRTFLRFSAYTGVLTFANNLLGQFATLYLLEQAGASNMSTQLIVVVAPMVGQILLLGIWGRAADRVGKKPLLAIASVGLIPVALGWSFVSPGRLWLGYMLSGLGAALWAGVEVSNLNLILEKGRSRESEGGSSFVAVNTVIINVAGCLGGLAAGAIAQVLGNWHWQISAGTRSWNFYDVLFVGCAAVRLLAVIGILPGLKERGARSILEALRFVGESLVRPLAQVIKAKCKAGESPTIEPADVVCVLGPDNTKRAA